MRIASYWWPGHKGLPPQQQSCSWDSVGPNQQIQVGLLLSHPVGHSWATQLGTIHICHSRPGGTCLWPTDLGSRYPNNYRKRGVPGDFQHGSMWITVWVTTGSLVGPMWAKKNDMGPYGFELVSWVLGWVQTEPQLGYWF